MNPAYQKYLAALFVFMCPIAVAVSKVRFSTQANQQVTPRPEHPKTEVAQTDKSRALATARIYQPAPFERVASGQYAGPPPVTRLQILDIARSALGVRYIWGGEAWDPLEKRFKGVDCSGLIAKAWQVPRASEVWQEVFRRPTTEILVAPNRNWFEVAVEKREPGDIFVRYDNAIKHVFIFESDDVSSDVPRVFVYEASAPEVRRSSYTLEELAKYRVLRRKNIDDIGIVGRSRDWIFGEFISAFRAYGGEARVGRPADFGSGMLVHRTLDGKGYAQDFDNGELGPTSLYRAEARKGAFLVTGAVRSLYLEHGGSSGRLGFPTSYAAERATDCGIVTRQTFEHGAITHECQNQPVVEFSDESH